MGREGRGVCSFGRKADWVKKRNLSFQDCGRKKGTGGGGTGGRVLDGGRGGPTLFFGVGTYRENKKQKRVGGSERGRETKPETHNEKTRFNIPTTMTIRPKKTKEEGGNGGKEFTAIATASAAKGTHPPKIGKKQTRPKNKGKQRKLKKRHRKADTSPYTG